MAYEKYVRKKRQLEQAVRLKTKKAERATKAPKKVSKSEAKITGAKPYFAKKQKKLQKTAKAIESRLEKLEKVKKPLEGPPLKMNLPNEETFKGRTVLRVNNVPGKIGNRILWKPISFNVDGGDKLAIIGPNGSGKTTLLKKIIHQEVGITISPAMKIGYFSQNLNILNIEKSILENVCSTSKQDETFIRTVLARMHFFRDDVYKPLGVLSGGEQVKVALAKLFVSDINTLIEYEGTVIFVSHDRHLIKNIATRILAIKDLEIELFEGTYEKYKHDKPQDKINIEEDQRLLLETKITEVLSRLSIEPTEELEMEFQQLLAEKRKLAKH
jgi:pleuromutilin/lincosamide/streptogramin A transport system ATP-binding/permease protein